MKGLPDKVRKKPWTKLTLSDVNECISTKLRRACRSSVPGLMGERTCNIETRIQNEVSELILQKEFGNFRAF